MAVAFSCDGCGKTVTKPVQLGHVLKRDYCAECASKAQSFIELEETAREQAQREFSEARKCLIASMSSEGFKLPDVP